ncbi:MAG: hypothetical protein H8E47_08280 [Anaerolineales bacterium]|nr:hypothetical protein [Anaerolineales bacterium]
MSFRRLIERLLPFRQRSREKPERQIELWGVSHDLTNEEIGKLTAAQAGQDRVIMAEGSLYLGGFIPQDAPRDKIFVIMEPPTLFTKMDGGRHPTRLYHGGRAIPAEGRGPRRMFETIAGEIESGSPRTDLRRVVHELLHLRRKYPDVVVYNEPQAWLRTVWYESDLLFQYVLCRSEYRLFGAFVYSDMDEAFGEFLRKHGNAVSAMTGDSCLLFAFDGHGGHDSDLYLGSEYVAYRSVLESPNRFEDAKTAADLDSLREVEARMLSEVDGINRSILFGRRLGLRVEDTPCLAFWESLDDKRVVTFSFSGLNGEAGRLRSTIKKLADVISEVVVEHKVDVLDELKQRTDALTGRGELHTPETVGHAIRDFLRENTPPIRDRLYVEDIDSFERVRTVSPAEVTGFLKGDGYLDMPEDEIQRAIEEILAVPFHKEDWGGEVNDLYSANLQVNGIRLPTAFLLKGNGLKRAEMRIADCGRNGDQLLRLFNSPAYLFVVQFVGNITEAVISDVQGKVAERRSSGKPAWYLVMDGQDTARLLHAYGKVR